MISSSSNKNQSTDSFYRYNTCFYLKLNGSKMKCCYLREHTESSSQYNLKYIHVYIYVFSKGVCPEKS